MVAALKALEPVTNDAESLIKFEEPYIVSFKIEGVAPLIFHRWSCEDVAEKANAKKGSRAKKVDNIEAFVWLCTRSDVCTKC